MKGINEIKILVVEGKNNDLSHFEKSFYNTKFAESNLTFCKTFRKSVKTLSQTKFDLVLIDLIQAGSEKIKKFNKIVPHVDEASIVVILGKDDEETAKTLMRLGAHDYLIHDSFDSMILEKTIELSLLLNKYNQEKENRGEKLRVELEKNIKNRERIERLNRLLQAIRSINKLIAVEKNKNKLISQACKILKEERKYSYVWLALLDKKGRVDNVAYAGMDQQAKEFQNIIKSSDKINCINNCSNQPDLHDIKNITNECTECPLAKLFPRKHALSVSVTHQHKKLGVLTVGKSINEPISKDENELLIEISEDLGLAINTIAVEKSHRKAKKQVKESEKFARSTIDSLTKHIAVIDETGKILTVNKAWRKFAEENRSNPDEVSEGSNYIKVCETSAQNGDEHAAKVLEGIYQVLNDDTQEFSLEYPCHSPSRKRWFNLVITKFESGDLTKLVIAHENISAIKLANEKLQYEKELMHLLMQNMPDTIYFKDREARFTRINDAKAKNLGLNSPDEAIGKTDLDYFKGSIAREAYEDDMNIIRTGKAIIGKEEKLTYKDGAERWVSATKVPVSNKEGEITGLIGISRDITDSKMIADKIKESEERFRQLYENALIGIYRTTPDGKFILANKALLNILGYESIEDINKKGHVKNLYADPEARNEYNKILEAKDVVYDFENQVITRNSKKIWVRESARVIRKENGEIDYFEGILEDISHKKLAEETMRKAIEKAEKSDRMKSEFLAQMSHEIRTPLNAMLSMAEFISTELGKGNIKEEIKQAFYIMRSSGERVIRTIDLILNVSEIQTGTYELIKKELDLINSIILPAVNKYKHAASVKNLSLEFHSELSHTRVSLDEYSTTQIILNLIDNAVKYTKEGKIDIYLEKEENNYLLKIKDTGIGISEEYISQIFEPFSQELQGYTRPYDGTGLGMTLVKNYCDLNGINISVESAKGKGTTFLLEIPAA